MKEGKEKERLGKIRKGREKKGGRRRRKERNKEQKEKSRKEKKEEGKMLRKWTHPISTSFFWKPSKTPVANCSDVVPVDVISFTLSNLIIIIVIIILYSL